MLQFPFKIMLHYQQSFYAMRFNVIYRRDLFK